MSDRSSSKDSKPSSPLAPKNGLGSPTSAATSPPDGASTTAQRSTSLSHFLRALTGNPSSSSASAAPATAPKALSATVSHDSAVNKPAGKSAAAASGLRLGPSPLVNRPTPSSSSAVGSLTGLLQSASTPSPSEEHPSAGRARRDLSASGLLGPAKSPLHNSYPSTPAEKPGAEFPVVANEVARVDAVGRKTENLLVPPEKLIAILHKRVAAARRVKDERKGKSRGLADVDGGGDEQSEDDSYYDEGVQEIIDALPASLDRFGSRDSAAIWLSVEPYLPASRSRDPSTWKGREARPSEPMDEAGGKRPAQNGDSARQPASSAGRNTAATELKPSDGSHSLTKDAPLERELSEAMREPGASRARKLESSEQDFAAKARALGENIKSHIEAEETDTTGPTAAAGTVMYWMRIRELAGAESHAPAAWLATSAARERVPVLVGLVSALTKGGKAIHPLQGVPDLLSSWSEGLFVQQEVVRREMLANANIDAGDAHIGVLSDSTRQTPFVLEPDQANLALRLVIQIHKFSCPQLSAAEVSRCTASMVSLALRTTSVGDVAACLRFVDTVVTFGYVPQEHLRQIICLVAVVLGMEGKEVVLDSSKRKFEELDPDLVVQARGTVRNLVRSPANQALRNLRSILSHCADPKTGPVDVPLVVGAIRCLRYALADNDEDAAAGSAAAQAPGAVSLLALDVSVLAPQLETVMSCNVPELDAEVLSLVDARLAVAQAKEGLASSVAPASVAGSDMWDLWDTTLDLMYIAAGRLQAWTTASVGGDRKSPWVLTAMIGASDSAPRGTRSAELALTYFSSVFSRLVQAHEDIKAPGPIWKLTELYLRTCGFLDDPLGVRLVEHCNRDHVCVPRDPDDDTWMDNIDQLVKAFIHERDSGEMTVSNLATSVSRAKAMRPGCPRTREMVMALVRDTYWDVRDLEEYRLPFIERIVDPLLERTLHYETDPTVLDYAIEIIRGVAQDELVNSLVPDGVAQPPQTPEADIFDRHHRLLFAVAASLTRPELGALANASHVTVHKAVVALIGMFNDALATTSTYAARKCVSVFRNLLALLSPTVDPGQSLGELSHDLTPLAEPLPLQTRLAILQWILRLRADQEHRIQFIRDIDVSGLATLLQRVNIAGIASESSPVIIPESPTVDRRGRRPPQRFPASPGIRAADSPDFSPARGRTGSAVPSSARDRSASRPKVSKPVGMWSIPETFADPTWPAEIAPESSKSLVAFDHQNMHEWRESVDSIDLHMPPVNAQGPGMIVLPISEYLAAMTRILRHEKDWDVVSYVLCFLPDQLSNKHFACGPRAADQIHQLRRLLCGGIIRDAFIDQVALPAPIKRTDAYAVAYQVLATLIAYRSLFGKAQQDEMVATFAHGLRTAGHAAKACIHAIAMACYELEPSVRKYLPEILTGLARILSTAAVSVHILELIATMAQRPVLYANLTETDFQTIFGIAIQYISNHNQQRLDEVRRGQSQPASEPQEVEEAVAVTSAFREYVYLMAYYIVAVWFVSLKVPERHKYVSFIAGRLVNACHGQSVVDEAAEVCLDMIARYTYSNAEPRPRPSVFSSIVPEPLNQPVLEKSWVLGSAVISIATLKRPGWAEVCVRRPSGIVRMLWELENAGTDPSPEMAVLNMVLRHRDALLQPPVDIPKEEIYRRNGPPPPHRPRARAASFSVNRPALAMDDALARLRLETAITHSAAPDISEPGAEVAIDPSFFQIQMSPYPDFPAYKSPIRVPSDPTYKRLISAIDYVPVVDFHKIAVLYVRPGQTDEREILANAHGSRTYVNFITELGELVRLKGCKNFYTGGLDTENDFHGAWTYVWDDDITQIVFHIATLMPTHLETDPASISKKALVGNDFVSIIFNDSGREYRFDTVGSQFNFINIIIEPHTPAGMAWTAPGMTNNIEFFKVSLQRRPGLPEIGPVGNFKMVSTDSLPHFVRQLALHANIFSQIYLATVGVKTASDRPRHRIEYVSHWRERLRQIRAIRNRIKPGDTIEPAAGTVGPTPIDVDMLSSARDFTAWTA